MSNTKVYVAGVGMTQFSTPKSGEIYHDIGFRAAQSALADAGIDYKLVQQGYAGYMFADTCAGQRILYQLGMNGIPIFNVNNACASGSSALFLARQAVEHGIVDCALAVGFEQMVPGALGQAFADRPSPLMPFVDAMEKIQGLDPHGVITCQLFAAAAREHIGKYVTKLETFAKIAVKARKHAAQNPNAVFRDELSVEEVMASPVMFEPLTRYQCCPPTTGAAAAVVCSEAFAKKHGIAHAVPILGQAMDTDFASAHDGKSGMNLVGWEMARDTSQRLYEQTGIGPEDVDVVELHDCFTANELVTYEAIGLAPEGGAEQFIEDGDNTYGGKFVVNPSGGLLSKGHPIGATGLAQCFELVTHMRGAAGKRQVEGAKVALQHNLGLGGAVVMTMYGSVAA